MKKIIDFIGGLMIVIFYIFIIVLFDFLVLEDKYIYTSDEIPPITYRFSLNKYTRSLKGWNYYSCDYEDDCEGKNEFCFVRLNKEEKENVMKLWSDKATISPILESLCNNDKIFIDSQESFDEFGLNEFGLGEFGEYDKNSDGKITHRELGNQMLMKAIEEKNNNLE